MTKEEFEENLKQARLPENLEAGIWRYVMKGVRPGDTLVALFTGDMFAFFSRADERTQEMTGELVRFVVSMCPSGCSGGRDQLNRWVQQGGLEGLELLRLN